MNKTELQHRTMVLPIFCPMFTNVLFLLFNKNNNVFLMILNIEFLTTDLTNSNLKEKHLQNK